MLNTLHGDAFFLCQVKAGNSYHSCCVVVKNAQRCVYAIPNSSVFQRSVILDLEEKVARSNLSAVDFRVKLQVNFLTFLKFRGDTLF